MLLSFYEDCGADVSHIVFFFFPYRLSSKLWWIVINVSDSDDSGGCVGEAIHGVTLHVSGLDDQRVLRHFLEGRTKEAVAGLNHSSLIFEQCNQFCSHILEH